MATTVTIPTPSIHWLIYPLLIVGLGGALWLWHDTQIKDAAAIQAVATAKTAQVSTDKQVVAQDDSAQKNLQTQNAALAAQLKAATTQAQQLALINAQTGAKLVVQTTQAQNPSSPPVTQLVAPIEDLPEIAQKVIDLKTCQNQVAADTIQQAGDKIQISSRDTTITAQNQEITALKGGSHLKRFLTGAKHVAIGVAVGVAVGYAIKK